MDMRDHEVVFDATRSPASPRFAPVFNAAVPFVERHVGEGRGDKLVIRCAAGDVSYAELASNVNRCANVLLDLGVTPGERLVMIVKDSPEFFYAFWGAIKVGVIPVPVNTIWRARDYAYILDDSQCAALLYSSDFAPEVGAAAATHHPAHAFSVEALLDRMADASDDAAPVACTAPEDDCFWMYSSGSTGAPKGVVHSHTAMVATSYYFGAGALGIGEDDICFSAAKLFFAYGLGNALTFPLWTGGQAVLLAGRPAPANVLAAIETYRPSVFFGVPTLYAAQLQYMEDHAADLSSVRAFVSAGEALPAKIFERWQEKTGKAIFDGIGSTELLNTFISNHADAVRPGTSGRIVPGYDARIIDETGTDVAIGETGELMIRGPSQFKHYWNKGGKTAETIVDGWVRTGDTYYQDADGFFVCCGRSDDMLKVGGIWCSPLEIESRLVEHPAVLEAVIVGRADGDELIKPEAFVVLRNGGEAPPALAGELLEFCKSGLAPYKYPRWFNFVDDLPRTATGKVQRFRLRGGAAN